VSEAAPPRPPFRWHVIQCQGTACTERGQIHVARELRNALFEAGAQERCRVSRTTCLNLCSMGPNAVVYPTDPAASPGGGTWYTGLTPSKVHRVALEHLAGDGPVADLAYRWDDPASGV
jgi:(2Fe-2S) ferredoxin